MSLIKIDSDLWRRFLLYGFGMLLGFLLVNIISKGKACQMPSTVKLEELNAQYIFYTIHASCTMACGGIGKQEINYVLKNGSINTGLSKVHTKSCPEFVVEGISLNGRHLRAVVCDCDTVSMVIKAEDMSHGKNTCFCK